MKRNKKAIIITAIIILASVLLIAFGIWGDMIRNYVYRSKEEFYPTKVTADNIGKKYRIAIIEATIDVEPENFYFQVLADPNVSEENYEAFWFGLDMRKIAQKEAAMLLSASENCEECYFTGILRKYDTEFEQQAKSSLESWAEEYYDENVELFKEYFAEITREKFIENELSAFTSYYFEVTDVNIPKPFNGTPYIVSSGIILFYALIFEICFVFKLKKRKIIPSVFAVLVIISGTASVILFDHIRTAVSVKEVGPGLYTMINYECTNTQCMIDANMQSIDDFVDWVLKEHFFNIPFEVDRSNFACAAFAAAAPDGDHLFGRNFDYDSTDTVLVYSHPKDGYASIGMADMAFVEVGDGQQTSADSIMGRSLMIVLPYAIMDGINEKGLGVGILELVTDEIHEDEGKPDILIFSALRAILDKCATVDEAIEFLDAYDVHSDLGNAYHLFVTDRSGAYAVIEWLDGEMIANRIPAVTNTVVTPGEHYGKGQADDRFDKIMDALSSADSVTADEAMDILELAKQENLTEWSCVYDLDDFSVDICLDVNYDNVYSFKGSDFE
ncbi:MAG: carcinine hydrolase/isopenicillin-N N-acyltransferase family protein [Oscillospiraceae bacterium]